MIKWYRVAIRVYSNSAGAKIVAMPRIINEKHSMRMLLMFLIMNNFCIIKNKLFNFLNDIRENIIFKN